VLQRDAFSVLRGHDGHVPPRGPLLPRQRGRGGRKQIEARGGGATASIGAQRGGGEQRAASDERGDGGNIWRYWMRGWWWWKRKRKMGGGVVCVCVCRCSEGRWDTSALRSRVAWYVAGRGGEGENCNWMAGEKLSALSVGEGKESESESECVSVGARVWCGAWVVGGGLEVVGWLVLSRRKNVEVQTFVYKQRRGFRFGWVGSLSKRAPEVAGRRKSPGKCGE
jgi:hypothetical protein